MRTTPKQSERKAKENSDQPARLPPEMQEVIVQRRMNVARGVAREREQILLREHHTHRLVIPQTRRAKAVQTQCERGEKDEEIAKIERKNLHAR